MKDTGAECEAKSLSREYDAKFSMTPELKLLAYSCLHSYPGHPFHWTAEAESLCLFVFLYYVRFEWTDHSDTKKKKKKNIIELLP